MSSPSDDGFSYSTTDNRTDDERAKDRREFAIGLTISIVVIIISIVLLYFLVYEPQEKEQQALATKAQDLWVENSLNDTLISFKEIRVTNGLDYGDPSERFTYVYSIQWERNGQIYDLTIDKNKVNKSIDLTLKEPKIVMGMDFRMVSRGDKIDDYELMVSKCCYFVDLILSEDFVKQNLQEESSQ